MTSQDGADQRQEPGRHRAVHVQGAQGRRFDHPGEVADLSRSGLDQAQHGDLQDRQGSVGAGERAAGGRHRRLPGLPGARAGRAPEEGSALRRGRRHDRGRGDPGDQQRQEAVQQSQGAPGDRPCHQPRGADLGRVGLRRADRQPLRAAQQGLYRPHQDLSVRHRQGQGAAGRGGLSQRLRGQPEAAAGGLRPARRRGDGQPARQDRHQGLDHPAAMAAVALRGVQGAQLRPHHRRPHRGQRPRSLCPRRLLLGLQFARVQGQVARGRGGHRLHQARRAPEGCAAHHRPRCGERLTCSSSPRSACGRRTWSACGRTRRRRRSI